MDTEFYGVAISLVSTIIGTVVGWILNNVQENNKNKAHLCYTLSIMTKAEIIKEGYYRENCVSGYCIKLFNLGNKPIFLDKIILKHKRKVILNYCVSECAILFPYNIYTCVLYDEEFEQIDLYCKKNKITKCKAILFDISGRKSKGKLDLFWANSFDEKNRTRSLFR